VINAVPPPPVIEQPVSYQLSYGVVTGTAAPGTRRVMIRVGSKKLADMPLRGHHFQLRISLPAAETTVQVVTVDRSGRRSRATVSHVLGAPRAATPVGRAAYDDAALQRTVRQLAARFGSTSGIFVQNLATGAGAAWNARAAFPAASSLKLAIAVTALARTEGTPTLGSTLDRLLRTMLTYSDNAAANATETYFGGSTSGGSYFVNGLMQSIGLFDTEMYGGYELDAARATTRAVAGRGRIPLHVDSQPYWGRGKKTSAYDLGSLLRAVWLASGGRGPFPHAQPGFTGSDARYLLYLLSHVQDPGKLDRFVGGIGGVRVLHKAGWINDARHDNGIVLWPGGAFIATVMTYRASGAGVSSDVLAGNVAAAALRRFRG
jgi:beta-lactamase class A